MCRPDKIIYAASVTHEKDFELLFQNCIKIPGQQAQKFNRLMIKGFAKNGVNVKVVSAPPIVKSNCNSIIKIIRKRNLDNICYNYLPIINIRGVKNITVMVLSFLSTLFSSIGRKSAVVCDVLNISVSLGAVCAGKLLGKKCVGIVTDVPELMVTGCTPKMLKYCHRIIDMCTDYVFLTEAMNERLNPLNKPYTIVEGICDEDKNYDISEKVKKKAHCLYAGLLDAQYGVKSMVDAFIKADIENSTLHICGSGPYERELKEVIKYHKNINYHGIMLNSDVLELEKQVSLLINPRTSEGEFTKCSFPSKNMEYMTSGTPVLANRLPGIPDEYYDYIYTFKGETVDDMAESLLEVLTKDTDELNKKGFDAYCFVTERKNSVIQAQKVLELI